MDLRTRRRRRSRRSARRSSANGGRNAARVANSLEEAGDKLFTFTRFPKSQWKSIRTSNAVERLHEEFKRRIKTKPCLPRRKPAAMLFWALLASGQITMRKVDGWRSLNESHPIRRLTSPHDRVTSSCWRSRQNQFQHKLRRHPPGDDAGQEYQATNLRTGNHWASGYKSDYIRQIAPYYGIDPNAAIAIFDEENGR